MYSLFSVLLKIYIYLQFISLYAGADDCISIVGLWILLKQKLEKVFWLGHTTEMDSPVSIHVKENIVSTENTDFKVVVEYITVFECDTFLKHSAD